MEKIIKVNLESISSVLKAQEKLIKVIKDLHKKVDAQSNEKQYVVVGSECREAGLSVFKEWIVRFHNKKYDADNIIAVSERAFTYFDNNKGTMFSYDEIKEKQWLL
jgi:hypothetical protein